MPTTTAPPILIWQPEGGIPGGSPISNPPVYSQANVTSLVVGQAYVDVVFGSIQTTTDWVLVECDVVNTADLTPLNIWPGLITNRTTAGFRVWLNGLPDTANYYLHWAVSGINIQPVQATLYLFTGPTSAPFGVDYPFMVKLPPSTTLGAPITVTPDDGGAGGTFSPPAVTLSSGSATATFIYNAVAYGAATISVTNSGTLVDPAPIVFTSIAPLYTFSGPSTGDVGVASTNFTVLLAGDATLAVPTTVTPHDGGAGGTFTPTSVLLVAGVGVHFTYTPASAGAKTISVTNDGGLTDPASLTYTATVLPLPTYTLSGPVGGLVSLASTNFTLDLAVSPVLVGTVVMTPSDGGAGGTFTPSTVSLTTASPTNTFTYTPASTGVKTISVTNNRGLTNPANLNYTVVAPFLDNFTGSGLLSSHTADSGESWVFEIGGANFNSFVASGSLYNNASGEELHSSYVPGSPDHGASITIIKGGTISGTAEAGMWLRAITNATNPRGYMGRYAEGSGYQFYRLDAGNIFVQLGSNVAASLANGDILGFSISGTGATVSLTLTKNGSTVATASDTSTNRIVTNGKVGIHLSDSSSGTGNYRIDKITSP